jgi:hypothetical protein
VRVVLPAHLRNLAQVDGEVTLAVAEPAPGGPTIGDVLDTIELAYPMLRGTIRDPANGKRRNFVRFFACNQDLSHEPTETPLPAAVTDGTEPFMVVGAMAGG